MFDSSQDILFITIALSIFVLSAFLVWFLYMIIMILKEARETVHQLRLRVEELFAAIESAKQKFQSTTATLTGLVREITVALDWIKKFRSKKKNTNANEMDE